MEDGPPSGGVDPGWHDVTAFLKDTAAGMKCGQMLHNSAFSLREAMSALELMDPQMDAGMVTEKVSLDSAIEDAKLPAELSLAQTLSVIDELVACEASWHDGQSMGHSLFVCLYMQRPEMAPCPILRAYIGVLLQTMRVVRQVVLDADLYEEEDFVPSMFHFSLGKETWAEDAYKALHTVEEQLDVRLKGLNGKVGGDDKSEAELVTAVLERVQFRKAIYSAHVKLCKVKELTSLVGCKKLLTRAQQTLGSFSKTLVLADPNPSTVLDHTTVATSTASTASASCTTTTATAIANLTATLTTPEEDDEKPKCSPTTAVTPGFHMPIAQMLSSSGPPRSVRVLSREAALKDTAAMLEDLLFMLEFEQHTATSEGALHFLHLMSRRQPNIVVRSHLMMLVGSETDFLRQGTVGPQALASMRRFCTSCNLPAARDHPDTDIYLNRMQRPYYLVFRLYCENRARQRRQIAKILPDWHILQDDAKSMDTTYYNTLVHQGVDLEAPDAPYLYAFFSWVFDASTSLLIHHSLLGLELGLYTPLEMPSIFWYLEYMFSIRDKNINMAYRAPPTAPKAVKGKAGKKGKAKAPKKGSEAPTAPVTVESLTLQAQSLLCRGLAQLVFALQRQGLVLPALSRDQQALWFMNRFATSGMVGQPSGLTLGAYENYADYYMTRVPSATQVLVMAQDSLAASKKLCGSALANETAPLPEEKDFLKALQRVCVVNSLTIFEHLKVSKSSAGVNETVVLSPKTHRMTFTFDACPQFPTISAPLKVARL